MSVDITHILLGVGLIIELLVLAYAIRVEREVAADSRRTAPAICARDSRSKS
jgi:hypothetical protein